MVLKLLIFLYVFCQILFYSNYTFIPKIVGSLLVASLIFSVTIYGKMYKLAWPLFVLFLLVGHAIVTFIVDPQEQTKVSAPSFTLISLMLFFLYQALMVTKGWKFAVLGFVAGIWMNYVIVFLFDDNLEFYEHGRFFGTLGNPNYFGYMVNLGLILTYWFESTLDRRWSKLIIITISLLAGLNVIWSGSKANIIIYISIILLYYNSVNGNFNFRTIFKYSLIKVIAAIILIYLLLSPFRYYIIDESSFIWYRYENFFNISQGMEYASESDLKRLDMIVFGFKNWVEKPFFGHGYDSFATLSKHGGYSHNNIIENIFNGGIYGVILFYSLYIYFIINFTKLIRLNLIGNIIPLGIFSIFFLMEFAIVSIDNKLYWIIIMILTAYIETTKTLYIIKNEQLS